MMPLYIIDIILFIVFACNIVYLLVFSIAAKYPVKRKTTKPDCGNKQARIAILIPAYKEDSVITECVNSCITQNYNPENRSIVVISDRMSKETNHKLTQLDIKLIKVFFENSTKSKALNYAMDQIGDNYDIALILDADNTIAPDFLSQINKSFDCDCTQVIQAHRCAKNNNTNMALLDAVSEEINNNIFRQGHINLGLSAALIGSGMAFNYTLFKKTMLSIDAIGGFDRALELKLLNQRIKIEYLNDAYVLDEKVQQHQDFSLQRRRWLSAQLHYLCAHLNEIPQAIKEKNWDFCDKIFQQMSMPRILILGFCGIIALILSFVEIGISIKWWVLLVLLMLALGMAIPRKLYTKRLLFATLQIPYSFLLMFLNVFQLRGANKKFIHTTHGVKS